MANGFHGEKTEWDRMARPLERLDPVLEEFGRRHGIPVAKGGRWPDRQLRWGAPVSRLIQIFVDDEQRPTYKLWICASEDRPSGRHWREETLLGGATVEELTERMPALLDEAFSLVSSWGSPDLELVRKNA